MISDYQITKKFWFWFVGYGEQPDRGGNRSSTQNVTLNNCFSTLNAAALAQSTHFLSTVKILDIKRPYIVDSSAYSDKMFSLKIFLRMDIENLTKGLKQLVMGYSSRAKHNNIILPQGKQGKQRKNIILPEEKKIIIPEEKKIISPLYLSPSPPLRKILTDSMLSVYEEVRDIEEEEIIAKIQPYNWADEGAITQHRYQGLFQTCWAFAPSIAASANHFIHKGILLELSVQFVVDKTESRGKEGDYPETWFQTVKKYGGLPLWQDYPYVLPQYPKGYKNAPLVQFGLKGYHRLDNYYIVELLKTGNRQPVIVDFPISMELLHYQEGEIISTYTFPPNPKDQGLHQTVIVGYEISPDGQRYFVHKDSLHEKIAFVNIAIELEIYTEALVPTYEKKNSVFLGQGTLTDTSQQQAGDGEKKKNKRNNLKD